MPSGISLVLPLADAHRNAKSGHKAASLSRLTAAGFDVPPGFVVGVDACRSHVWNAGLTGTAGRAEDAEAREELRAAVLGRDIAEDVRSVIARAYEELALACGVPEPRVAVRPSAPRDFPSAYESCLNVAGLDELEEAVKRVWASLWNGRAAAFRARLEAPCEPAMAVIVQQMVDREIHGTATTANPITGNPIRVCISCESPGGRCDHLEHDLADPRPMTHDPRPTTHDPRLSLVAERAIMVEGIFGSPVEIEWAHDGERLWILQARAMADLPVHFPDCNLDRGGAAPSRHPGRPAQRHGHHVYPPGNLEWRRLTLRPVSALARGILWNRPCALSPFPAWRGRERRRLINGYGYHHRAGIDGIDEMKEAARVQPREIAIGLRLLEQWRTETVPRLREKSSAIIGSDLSAMDRRDMFRQLRAAVDLARGAVDLLDQSWYPSARFPKLLRGFVGSGTEGECLYQRLIAGIETPALARDIKLQDLADRLAAARASGRLEKDDWWRGFKREVDDLAREYGYAFSEAGEAYDPASWTSWIEDRDTLLRVVGALARRGRGSSLLTLHTARQRSAQRAEEEACEMYEGRAGEHFRNLLALSRGWLAARGEVEQTCALAFTALRLVLNELARGFQLDGVIAAVEDIYYLQIDDVLAAPPCRAGVAGQSRATALIARRKHELWLESRLAAPEKLPADGRHSPISDVLRGLSASPGTATGRARVAASVAEAAEIERGEILVVGSASPVWTAFFGVAGGFVAEQDDATSIAHIALDYGIPALAGCMGASNVLRSGMRIAIDGSAGTVELTKKPAKVLADNLLTDDPESGILPCTRVATFPKLVGNDRSWPR